MYFPSRGNLYATIFFFFLIHMKVLTFVKFEKESLINRYFLRQFFDKSPSYIENLRINERNVQITSIIRL